MALSNAERQRQYRQYRQRLQAQGMTCVSGWVPETHASVIRQMLAGEVPLPRIAPLLRPRRPGEMGVGLGDYVVATVWSTAYGEWWAERVADRMMYRGSTRESAIRAVLS